MRGLIVHGALLALASVAAIAVWTREKKTPAPVGEVTIWNARPAAVEHVSYEAKGKSVTLDAHKDGVGIWFSGVAETTGHATQDGGAAPTKKTTFVSVGAANRLAEAIAPLHGLRELGRIGDDRAAEFGLADPEGTLRVTIDGKPHTLVLGAKTPGGADRYVRDSSSNIAYVVKNDLTRDLESPDSSFIERELHDIKDADIESLRVSARGKTREVLRRGPETKRVWSDPSNPDTQDETVSNWLAKIDRLRPVEYVAPQPAAPQVLVRIDYKVKGSPGVFAEIAKVPGAAPPETSSSSAPPKPDFLVRTERTRQWAKVLGTVAEQVEQDLASVLK
jgi:hypothetical protein